MKPRVTRTLLKTFLDINRVFGTYYGCLKGVSVLEGESIRFFLGNLSNWARLVFNESGITLDNIEEHLKEENNSSRTKFTKEETHILVDTVISALLVLKKDLPDLYQGKGEKVTDEDKEKLVERCGVTIGYHILERDDAKELISAIFFGE